MKIVTIGGFLCGDDPASRARFDAGAPHVTAGEAVEAIAWEPCVLVVARGCGVEWTHMQRVVERLLERERRGVPTVGLVEGWAGSGWPIVLAACTARLMGPGSYLRFHGATIFGADGSRSRSPADDAWALELVCSRTGAPRGEVGAAIARWWDTTPRWKDFTAGEALRLGLANAIGDEHLALATLRALTQHQLERTGT